MGLQAAEASRPRDVRPVMPPSSQPIASLSSSESAAAISLLALAPGTPPGLSSPSGTPPSGGPSLQLSASGSGDLRAAQVQQQLATQRPGSGQAQPAEPMDSDMAPAGDCSCHMLLHVGLCYCRSQLIGLLIKPFSPSSAGYHIKKIESVGISACALESVSTQPFK